MSVSKSKYTKMYEWLDSVLSVKLWTYRYVAKMYLKALLMGGSLSILN